MTTTEHPTDRMPPHDLVAEQSLLGGLLLSSQAWADVDGQVSAEDFYRPAHGAVYRAIERLHDAGDAVDAITVADELDRAGDLHRVGGAPYIHTLVQTVPTAANASYYADIVAEKAALRRIVEAGTRITQIGYGGGQHGDLADVLDLVQDTVAGAVDATAPTTATTSAADLVDETIRRYGTAAEEGLRTGYADLDDVLSGGLQKGTLTIIAARPGVGKTLLAGNISATAARAGVPVLFVSLEMSSAEVMDRWVAGAAKVELSHLIRRELDDSDWKRIEEAAPEIAGWPVEVSDDPSSNPASIRRVVRDLTRRGMAPGLIVVDYLQLMESGSRVESRQQEVSQFSRKLKLLAKEFDAPVVALSQLNRGPEQRTDKRPMLSDLRESGAIEQDADKVLLLHLDEERQGELDVIVAKNRQGRTGSVSLAYAPHYALIRSLARD